MMISDLVSDGLTCNIYSTQTSSKLKNCHGRTSYVCGVSREDVNVALSCGTSARTQVRELAIVHGNILVVFPTLRYPCSAGLVLAGASEYAPIIRPITTAHDRELSN